jgi:hypothetical protein
MMRRFLLPPAIALMAVGVPCAGQQVACPLPVTTAAILAFVPATPSSSQPITFTVGYQNAFPSRAVATVLGGNVINVTIDGMAEIVFTPPPTACFAAIVGPLPVGTYTVNLIGTFNRVGGPPPRLLATKTLTVTPSAATDPSTVPTLSDAGILALAVLLSLAGWSGLRRRLHRRRSLR